MPWLLSSLKFHLPTQGIWKKVVQTLISALVVIIMKITTIVIIIYITVKLVWIELIWLRIGSSGGLL
jgi:hypothetical protein